MEPLDRRVLTHPGSDVELAVEDYGEHHMSCWHVVFVLSPSIDGVGRIKTTNGTAFLSPCGAFAVLHDRVFLVVVDFAEARVHHLAAGPGRGFCDVRIEHGVLRWNVEALRVDVRDGQLHAGAVALDPQALAAAMTLGWGPAAGGRFPSAFGA